MLISIKQVCIGNLIVSIFWVPCIELLLPVSLDVVIK